MVRFRLLAQSSVMLALLYVTGCHRYTVSSGRPEIVWKDISETVGPLASSVEVYEGIDEKTPLHAWYARVNLRNPDVESRIMVSNDADGQETTSDLARVVGACLAVNGGYFVSGEAGSRPIGLLMSGGKLIHHPTTGIIVDEIRYPAARAAIGFFENGTAEVAWVTSKNDSVFTVPKPPGNRPGYPDEAPAVHEERFWNVVEALAAGPALVHAGRMSVTDEEEIFFNTPIPNVHPRTAAGVDADGALLLLVVDGRQPDSRGVSLPDLATIMMDLDAEYALNLDGGGSSSFVVNGQLLNRPVGGENEREVVSGISVHCLTDENGAVPE